MSRISLLVLGVLSLGSVITAAEVAPAVIQLDNGGLRRGAGSVVFSDKGRMSIYVGTECLVQNACVGCGLGGYTNSDHFTESRAQREVGRYYYEGKLPKHDVRFSIEAVPDGDVLQVHIQRVGEWPTNAGWCAFQMHLPISQYGGSTMQGRWAERGPAREQA